LSILLRLDALFELQHVLIELLCITK
jgi:hypothetical protein